MRTSSLLWMSASGMRGKENEDPLKRGRDSAKWINENSFWDTKFFPSFLLLFKHIIRIPQTHLSRDTDNIRRHEVFSRGRKYLLLHLSLLSLSHPKMRAFLTIDNCSLLSENENQPSIHVFTASYKNWFLKRNVNSTTKRMKHSLLLKSAE